MAVDPLKPRKILVVHGVNMGRDEDINSHEMIRELIKARLKEVPVEFETDLYRYENINDEAQEKLRRVLSAFLRCLTDRIPFGSLIGTVIDRGVDVVADVVVKLAEGSTAAAIRDGLIERIENVFQGGNPLYIVAHSLGSVYSFDAVNQLIRDDRYFDRDSRRTWPVQALVTLGSPIGLSMFNRNTVEELGLGRHYFRWINYWARTDPVVSGSFYGKPVEGYQIAERFATDRKECGWIIQDRVVDVGRAWLKAHVGYLDDAAIGDDLVTLITS